MGFGKAFLAIIETLPKGFNRTFQIAFFSEHTPEFELRFRIVAVALF